MNYFRRPISLTAALTSTALTVLLPAVAAHAEGLPEPAAPQAGAQIAPVAAPAATTQKPMYPLRVRLGAFFPDSRSQSHGLGSAQSFGVDYDYWQTNLLGGPTTVGFYTELDNGKRFGRKNSAEFSLNTIGIGAQVRRIIGKSVDSRNFYFGGAAGLYRTKYVIDPTGPARYDKDHFGIGLKLLLGYQFDKRFFVQIDSLSLDRYWTRNSNGIPLHVEPGGSRLSIGYRF